MNVSLFVTGKTEQAALARALGRLFPSHSFTCVPHIPPHRHFRSMTSNRLELPLPVGNGARTIMDELVQNAAAEVTRTSARDGRVVSDLVVMVDDLELCNVDQHEVVVRCFRDAVQAHLDTLEPRLRERTGHALRTKASLHFAVPHLEAWLFADPNALVVAGLPSHRSPRLICGDRYEEFHTDDPDYDEDDCSRCEKWQQVRARPRLTREKRRANEPEWCKTGADRRRHPKRYLSWLCRDRGAKQCTAYQEVRSDGRGPSGATALRDLDWAAVASAHMPFLHWMIRDLADGLDEPGPPLPDATIGIEASALLRGRRVLRNI